MIYQIDETKFPGRVVGVTRNGGRRKGHILCVAVRSGARVLLCSPTGEIRERAMAADGRGRQIIADCTEVVA